MAEEYATKGDISRVLERLDAFSLEIVDQVVDRILTRLEAVRIELIERDEAVETKLLKEFRKWAISFESKFKVNEALVVGFSERMTSLEERVSGLERKD